MFYRHTRIATALLLLLAMISVHITDIRFENGSYRAANTEQWIASAIPIIFESTGDLVEVQTTLTVFPMSTRSFRIIPDDCLKKLFVNGQRVESPDIPFCDYAAGRVIDLSAYLVNGINDLHATVLNTGGQGSLAIQPIRSNVMHIMPYIFLTFAFFIITIALARAKNVHREYALLALFLCGTVLRIAYLAVTPFELRGHDTDGHIQYISFMAENFSLPSIGDGWQFYQPPLYYFVWGMFTRVGSLMHIVENIPLESVQFGSLFLTIAMLVIGIWTGMMIFPRPEERLHRILFTGILSVFPGFIFFASRINNDVLVQFFAFLSFAFLYRWWQSPSGQIERHSNLFWWTAMIAAAALGLVTKMNALLLLPIIGLCLLSKPGLHFRNRLRLGVIALIIFGAIAGPYAGYRFIGERQTHLVGNLGNLNNALRVDSTLASLTEFNPIRVIAQPYNDPWSDAEGRNNFWEYFVKSAFFGEFKFESPLLGSLLLTTTLLLSPFVFYGMLALWRQKRWSAFPCISAAIVLAVGHVLYRQSAPFSSSQDFRYSLLLLVPIAACLVSGILAVRNKWLRSLAMSTYGLFVCFCLLFIVGIIT